MEGLMRTTKLRPREHTGERWRHRTTAGTPEPKPTFSTARIKKACDEFFKSRGTATYSPFHDVATGGRG